MLCKKILFPGNRYLFYVRVDDTDITSTKNKNETNLIFFWCLPPTNIKMRQKLSHFYIRKV